MALSNGDIEVAIAILTCLGCTAMVIWKGGIMVGRVESAIERLAGIEAKLKKVDVLEVQYGVVSAVQERHHSDVKELRGEISRIRERVPTRP